MRILRLIENMTMGRNAVGYLTESLHGAGSPQAQRIQIGRAMQLEFKKDLAKALAGIGPQPGEQADAGSGAAAGPGTDAGDDPGQYLNRVFRPVEGPGTHD